MAKLEHHHKAGEEENFLLDGAYLKREAHEAAKTFFAPLSGVYLAIKGATPATETVKRAPLNKPYRAKK